MAASTGHGGGGSAGFLVYLAVERKVAVATQNQAFTP
jgi:hypothetical protein